MERFTPEVDKIFRYRKEMGIEESRESLNKLREQAALNQQFLGKVLTELFENVASNENVSAKELLTVVNELRQEFQDQGMETAQIMDRLIGEGIREYISYRKFLKTKLTKLGELGVLRELFGDSPKDGEENVIPDDLDFNLEIGPVNYNIFLTAQESKRAPMLKKDDAGGFATQSKFKNKPNFSVIYTSKLSTAQDRLLLSVFGKDYHPTNDLKKIQHENFHQLDGFISRMINEKFPEMSIDTSLDYKNKVAERKNRLNTLIEFQAPDVIVQNEVRLLIDYLENNNSELNESFYQTALEELKSIEQEFANGATREDLEQRLTQQLAQLSNEKDIRQRKLDSMLQKAKAEVLAYVYDGRDLDSIEKLLTEFVRMNETDPAPLYNFDKSDKLGEERDELANNQYVEVIKKSLASVESLEEIGYSRAQIASMFIQEPLVKWPAIARNQKKVFQNPEADKTTG